jgi:hypothetical protein
MRMVRGSLLSDMFYREGPSVTEPQPKDEKIFNHKERKDHKKE